MSERIQELDNEDKSKLSEIVDLQIKDQLFSIVFYNNENSAKFYELFQKKFHKYLKKGKKNVDEKSSTSEKVPNFGEFTRKRIANISHHFQEFIIDNFGDLGLDMIANFDRKYPVYVQDNSLALSEDFNFNELIEIKTNNKACFNCGACDHNLNECKHPKNLERINEKRREFLKGQSFQRTIPNVRYHEEAEEAPSKRFQPGTVSENLRFALGLAKDEIPPYIYKMRMIGYPPGYSLQAHLNSQLTMIESDDETFGNLDLKDMKKKMVYSIVYPGFNAPMPRGFVDRSKEFGFPRIDPSIFIKQKTEDEEAPSLERKIVPDVIDTTIINRGFYLDPLVLNVFPATRFWRNPPNLQEGSNLESYEEVVNNPVPVDSNPFSDECIPANRYMKILKLLKNL